MDKPLVLTRSVLLLFIIFLALIPLSRCNSRVKAIEGKRVKLEFSYPCDSNEVTIQRANGAPFYYSAEPGYLNLPDYDSNRFSVEEKNCSVQVEINLVMSRDRATYICIAYKDDVILELIRVRLNVDYPPGRVSCAPRDKVHMGVGDWVPLQCEASAGSLAGEILCYQDAKRLPPYNELVQNDEILKQSIWATEEYPVFCCSSILRKPKDICECNDFAWDPSYTQSVLHPCPSVTPRQGTTIKDQLRETSSTDRPFLKITPLTHPDTYYFGPWLWVCLAIIALLGGCLFLVTLFLWRKGNLDSTEKKDEYTETGESSSMAQDCAFQELDLLDIRRKQSKRESNAESKKPLLYPEYGTV